MTENDYNVEHSLEGKEELRDALMTIGGYLLDEMHKDNKISDITWRIPLSVYPIDVKITAELCDRVNEENDLPPMNYATNAKKD